MSPSKYPIPALSDLNQWIGHQLKHKRLPKEYTEEPPTGKSITPVEGHPAGLLAIPNPDGSPRIIVPRSPVLALVQTHEDIHHQSHIKVLCILTEASVLLARDGQRCRIYMYSLPNVHGSIG
jgi:hypothetical protein